MGSLSPTAMRRAGRFGVPIVAALAAVLVSTQGASAAPAKPYPPVPPPCAAQPVPGMAQPMVSQSGSRNGGVVVTKPGKPGKPGQVICVICGDMGKPGTTEVRRPGKKCVICIVHVTTGRAHGGSGSVTSSAGDGQGTVGQGGSSGSVTIGQGGGGVVSVGGPAPFCPPIKVGTSQR